MWGSIVSEDTYHTYSFTTTAISCLSNLLLIYTLAVTHLTQVGPYRYLLLVYAVVDIIISLVHLALIPAIHMTEFGYIYFGYRFLHESTAIGVWASLIWVALFYQTFVLLAFHFVYRYVLLCRPSWLTSFRSPWRFWLTATFVADFIFIGGILLACLLGLLPTEVSRKAFAPVLMEVYDINLYSENRPGYLGIVYWTINENGVKEWIIWNVMVIVWVIFLFFTTAAIIVFCIVNIVRELSGSRVSSLAPATKKLQKQLFNTLLWQTVIPCFTSYTPLAMIFLVPLTGIPLEGFGTVFIMSTALFPMLDPYIVIFLISGYRKALQRRLVNILKPEDTRFFCTDMFGSIVSERFYHTFAYTTTAISCLSNLLLIYVLAMIHLSHVGPYRYLLLIFSVVDILISIVHLIVIPAIHMTDFGYIYFGYRFLEASTFTGVLASLIWVLLFYQTFVLLAFHYVYRYMKLCSPTWLSWFRVHPWRKWLVVILLADVGFVGGILLACFAGLLPTEVYRKAFAPVLKKVYNIDLFAPNAPGFLGIVYWTVDEHGVKQWVPWSVSVILWVILLFFTTAVVILWCIVQIVRALKKTRIATMSNATRRLQKQLFKTLLWQTIIPCFTSYTPLAMLFMVPLSGVALEGFGTVFIMSTALFPMLDPYIVIFLINGYRTVFLRWLASIIRERAPHSIVGQSTTVQAQRYQA